MRGFGANNKAPLSLVVIAVAVALGHPFSSGVAVADTAAFVSPVGRPWTASSRHAALGAAHRRPPPPSNHRCRNTRLFDATSPNNNNNHGRRRPAVVDDDTVKNLKKQVDGIEPKLYQFQEKLAEANLKLQTLFKMNKPTTATDRTHSSSAVGGSDPSSSHALDAKRIELEAEISALRRSLDEAKRTQQKLERNVDDISVQLADQSSEMTALKARESEWVHQKKRQEEENRRLTKLLSEVNAREEEEWMWKRRQKEEEERAVAVAKAAMEGQQRMQQPPSPQQQDRAEAPRGQQPGMPPPRGPQQHQSQQNDKKKKTGSYVDIAKDFLKKSGSFVGGDAATKTKRPASRKYSPFSGAQQKKPPQKDEGKFGSYQPPPEQQQQAPPRRSSFDRVGPAQATDAGRYTPFTGTSPPGPSLEEQMEREWQSPPPPQQPQPREGPFRPDPQQQRPPSQPQREGPFRPDPQPQRPPPQQPQGQGQYRPTDGQRPPQGGRPNPANEEYMRPKYRRPKSRWDDPEEEDELEREAMMGRRGPTAPMDDRPMGQGPSGSQRGSPFGRQQFQNDEQGGGPSSQQRRPAGYSATEEFREAPQPRRRDGPMPTRPAAPMDDPMGQFQQTRSSGGAEATPTPAQIDDPLGQFTNRSPGYAAQDPTATRSARPEEEEAARMQQRSSGGVAEPLIDDPLTGHFESGSRGYTASDPTVPSDPTVQEKEYGADDFLNQFQRTPENYSTRSPQGLQQRTEEATTAVQTSDDLLGRFQSVPQDYSTRGLEQGIPDKSNDGGVSTATADAAAAARARREAAANYDDPLNQFQGGPQDYKNLRGQ